MRLRKLIRVLHRDVGYFLAGLVILYSISGVAVNHIDAWNPSYSTESRQVDVGPLTGSIDAMQEAVVAQLELDPEEVAGRHRPSATEFVLFLPDGGRAKVNPKTGKGSLVRRTQRPVLFQANVLHLNHLKGWWTWVADAIAVLLFGLAVTGLFMLPGKNGFGGRGKWFFTAGLLVPIGALWWYYATR